MGELEEPVADLPIECPVCHHIDVRRPCEAGLSHECQKCAHQFLVPPQPSGRDRDYDFPSPEDHELQ